MIENLKLQLITLTEAVHLRVFGHEMSDKKTGCGPVYILNNSKILY
ncbi:MAG: hypothetical protein WC682_02820 [Parcubacteria group bacterium]|jgi:hypothetical protein